MTPKARRQRERRQHDRNQKIWDKLRAEILPEHCLYDSLADRVDDVLDRARINADDTVYVEKAAPERQWGTIALGSIEQILACDREMDDEVRGWFTQRGIRY